MQTALVLLPLVVLLAPGCVTVNINFPAKEVEKAAEVIVGQARPLDKDDASGGSPQGGEGQPTGASSPRSPVDPGSAPPVPPEEHRPVQGRTTIPAERNSVLVAFTPPQDKKDSVREDDIKIDIKSPAIKAIRESLEKRFPKIRVFYDKGAVGETLDGYVEIRDDSKLSLVEKRDVRALVDEENRDRKNLYLEIVRANRFDESRLKDVQVIFGKIWIKGAATGWWIQTPKREWIKKPPPKEEKKEGKKPEKKGAAA